MGRETPAWLTTGSIAQIYTKVLLHANAAAGNLLTDTDSAVKRADDAVDEGCYVAAREHESTDESTGTAEDSDGV